MSLLDALREMYPDSSTTTLRALLKHQRVRVDGTMIAKANHSLLPGQTVSTSASTKNMPSGFDVIYEDRDIIIVNKPPKLLSVPLDGKYAPNLLKYLRDYYKSSHINPVHRLDKAASGVMVFSRSEEALAKLNEMFRKHNLKREYIAVVRGNVQPKKGTWKSTLLELNNGEVRSGEHIPDGKDAVTHYDVFHRSKNFSFLRLTLETGRKHQIRVHCKEAGHPIAGDVKYGDKDCDPLSRMCLHAHLLEFTHPTSKKLMCFTAPVPSSFIKLGMLPSGSHYGAKTDSAPL